MKRPTLMTLLSVLAITAASTSAFAKTITLEHLMGKTTLETEPQRVVVIGIGAIDAVDALGIKPVAVSKIAPFPGYLSQYGSKDYPSVGTIFEPDFEAIYSQKPDLIIVGSRSSKHFDELSKIAPTYVFTVPNGTDYWQGTQKIWHDLGTIFDKDQLVNEKITDYNQRFNKIKAYNQSHDVDALMLMSSGGNITSFGEGSRFAVLYQDFGFKPTMAIAPKKETNSSEKANKSGRTGGHGNLVSYELVAQENPSTLLILDRDKLVNKEKSTTRQDFENDLVKSTDAYKNQRMVYLDIPAWYVAGSGITATGTMIQDIEALTKTN